MGLIVQRKALQAAAGLRPMMAGLRKRDRSLFDQVHRAMNSVVLNIAEADGNDPGTAKARFASACGSAKEVRAGLGQPRRMDADADADADSLLALAAQHPGDGAHLVELSIEGRHDLHVEVPPITSHIERGPNLLGRTASGRKSKLRIATLVPAPLGDVQHHTLRRPP